MAVLLSVLLCTSHSSTDSEAYPEHEVKAAFLYNFMRLTTWPDEKLGDPDTPMKLIVIGNYKTCKTLKDIQKKKLHDRDLEVAVFTTYKEIKDPNFLKQCHVLYICNQQAKYAKQILEHVKENKPLTVSDEINGFLEMGGIINIKKKNQKIRFEVNLKAAKKSNLKIRSKLLKLAIRVIK